MYVYFKTEANLWTAGFYHPNGEWEPESDHPSRQKAAERVAQLNGGTLRADIRDILEVNHQAMEDGYCPWCGADEYIDVAGDGTEEYHCDHTDTCPVAMLEQALASTYQRRFD